MVLFVLKCAMSGNRDSTLAESRPPAGRAGITNHGYTRFLLLPTLTFSLSFGYLHGRFLSIPSARMSLRPETRPPVCTVVLEGIYNGNVEGKVIGAGRLILGKTPVIGSGSFSIPAGTLLSNIITIDIPDGAVFVASKRGKKYYTVDSASATSLSPQNRVYFRSAADAEAAGYTR